ncbi:MAG: hypothetical protein QM723_30715 [Myxococcaceae bacterium]
MLPALLLSLVASSDPGVIHLDTTPHRARLLYVTLMTQEQLESAPVEMLSMPQLQAENARLSNPPSLGPPAGMLGGGVALLVLGILGTWGCIEGANHAHGWDGLGWAFLGVITAAVGVVGAVLAIVGSVLLGTRSGQRSDYEARRIQVQTRMQQISAGQVQEPAPAPGETPQAQAELLHEEAEKPGYGLPIGLMIGGGVVGTYGIFAFTATSSTTTTGSSSSTLSPTALGIGAIVIALALEGVGIWQLISRMNERAEIDAKAKQRYAPQAPIDVPPPPPPPSAQLPGAPVFAAWAWKF